MTFKKIFLASLVILCAGTVVLPIPIICDSDTARMYITSADLKTIETALDLYKKGNGVYPTTAQGLEALIEKPTIHPVPSDYPEDAYLKNLPYDPWGNSYHYQNEAGNVLVWSNSSSIEEHDVNFLKWVSQPYMMLNTSPKSAAH